MAVVKPNALPWLGASALVLLLVIQVVLFVLQRLSAEFRPILFS